MFYVDGNEQLLEYYLNNLGAALQRTVGNKGALIVVDYWRLKIIADATFHCIDQPLTIDN
eukprot:scaffold67500_cov70-Cyclotella_meneghiniana.AAC.8